VEAVERIHPDPFHDVSRARFLRAADRLRERLAGRSDERVLVGLMRLAALPSLRGRDGHLGLWPPDNPEAIHRFPIRVWSFPEGLHVTAAMNGAAPVGARVLRVNGSPIGAVLARLDRVVPRDTRSNLRAARTVFLTSAEVLVGLGLADTLDRVTLAVETRSGEWRSVTVPSVDADTFADWVDGWELLLPPRPGLAFLRDAARPSVVSYRPAERTVLVRYNVVLEGSGVVVARIRSATREGPVERIVLDLRSNGGGQAGGYRELLRYLAGSRIPLRVLIGRLTFSAAASFVTAIQRRIPDATLIGETMGGATSFWANPSSVRLPNSGLNVLIPSGSFGSPGRDEGSHVIRPDLAVPFTAADYFGGRDPPLERALR
jgi:hypothetical protein